jgi:hypothetical protein
MAKRETKKAVKRKTIKKPTTKWTEEFLAVKQLIEEELHGLLDYLRTIHHIAIVLMLTAFGFFLYGTKALFTDTEQTVIAFLIIIATSLVVALASAWALRPWILPRFLLPMDMNGFDLDELVDLVKDPSEYLTLLKTHTQILTDQYLIPKLRRLRNAIALFLFGMSIAIILSIALP